MLEPKPRTPVRNRTTGILECPECGASVLTHVDGTRRCAGCGLPITPTDPHPWSSDRYHAKRRRDGLLARLRTVEGVEADQVREEIKRLDRRARGGALPAPARGKRCSNRGCSNEVEYAEDDLCPWCREKEGEGACGR